MKHFLFEQFHDEMLLGQSGAFVEQYAFGFSHVKSNSALYIVYYSSFSSYNATVVVYFYRYVP